LPGPPFGWSCASVRYRDGVCDCGCGAPDVDCTHSDIGHCERCNTDGACNGGECPGRIDPNNTTHCTALPTGWTCNSRDYADGMQCDCGCGVADPDCADAKSTSCDKCNDAGACSHGTCPSSLDPDNNAVCKVPKAWLCGDYNYGDGWCDCGCGVVDIDCPSSKADVCQYCLSSGCSPYGCSGGTIDPNNNAICTVAPPNWTCPTRLYNDGSGCDCGCGFPDPDCASNDVGACDRCNAPSSCSAQACPGIIDPQDNAHCTAPVPPPEWQCPTYQYGGDGLCECGCGAMDPDCRGTTTSFCESCPTCGPYNCPSRIDSTDISKCAPAPTGWTCDTSHYADGTCDCGCGVIDVDCPMDGTAYCYSCPVEGCSAGDCSRIKTTDSTSCLFNIPSGWKCDRLLYGDSVCDCGCGVVDRDCANATRNACDYCKDAGSCSTTACPGTISATDNSSCTPATP
jgi:hypothetical protein